MPALVQRLNTTLKATAKGLCDAAGLNGAVIRKHRSELMVLCYHGVLERARSDRWSYANCVGRDSFREQLRWLRSVLEPVGLDGLRQWHEGAWTGKKGPLLITFDDGYRNNLTHAAPVLREEGAPALFFLTTGYVGSDRTLWNDEVRIRVLDWPEEQIRLPSGGTEAPPPEPSARRALADRISGEVKRISAAESEEYLAYLRSRNPLKDVQDDPEARAFLTWDEARKLASMGFDVGAHTVEHPILSQTSGGRLVRELRQSKETIERELARPCESMAYPNGLPRDMNSQVFLETRRAGYRWAFTTSPGWHTPGADPYGIPRMVVPGHTDLATFKFWVSGLHSLFAGVR